MSNRTVRTPEHAREAFLSALSTGASIAAACREAGIGRTTAYDMRGSDEAFAASWEAALENGTDRLEDEALRRAVDGVVEPVISGGRQMVDADGAPMVVRRYSDPLLTMLLKARRPDKYRDRVSADLRADVKLSPSPEEGHAVMIALLDGLASRKAAGLPTPELDALPI